MQWFPLLGPPDTGLGALPNYVGHGKHSVLAIERMPYKMLRFWLASSATTSSRPSKPHQKSFPAQLSENSASAMFPIPTCVLNTRRRALARSQILRATSANSPIPPNYYNSISKHLSDAFQSGTYLKDGGKETTTAPPNPLTDPAAMDGMMSGMKTQMVMMVPQMVIMGWINFFFQGFVLSKP